MISILGITVHTWDQRRFNNIFFHLLSSVTVYACHWWYVAVFIPWWRRIRLSLIDHFPSFFYLQDKEVHISLEDQQKINKFARLNNRWEDFKEEVLNIYDFNCAS